jgi:2-keto-4-pentenoate hydratase/2-oxohepta-3-ene-1,7-dioic acid hydratase in catechol pathway/regulator of RNase E activity RraA
MAEFPTPGPGAAHPLAGTIPSKIIAVHLSYRSRAMERGRLPQWPSYFLKPPSTLAANGDPVRRPPRCELLGFEGEVALVIGTRASRVAPADAWDHVRWVTAANDFGVYDLRYADNGSNVRSKGIDGFTPIGPTLLDARAVDPERLRLRTWLNGELAQDAVTGDDLLFSCADIIADISRLTTLEPGDVILTGTPTGATVARPGDLVEVEVSADDGDQAAGPRTTGRLRSPITEADYDLSPPGAMPNADDAQREAAYGARGAHGSRGRSGFPGPANSPGPADSPGPANSPGSADSPAASNSPAASGSSGSSGISGSPAELLLAVSAVSTATLSAQLRRRGFNSLTLDGLHTTRPSQKMAGFARTLRYVPFREDLSAQYGGTPPGGGLNAQKRAVEQIRPGEILVIEARGDPTAGTVGDILALRAQVRGARGIVTDGAIRDSQTLRTGLDIPVYYGATHPAVLGRRHVPWETGTTIACAGVTVTPGDIIVGDGDGVLVVPAHLALEVARDAAEQERQEQFAAEMVAKGESVDGLYPLGPRWQAAYQAWQRSAPGAGQPAGHGAGQPAGRDGGRP